MHNWNEILTYCDGKLYWATKPKRGTQIGDPVGNPNKNGYLRFQYKGKYYLVHRIVWEMHNGEIPAGMQIDHLWHNKLDNRIENLRLVSPLDNHRNRGKAPKNTSGVTGVCWSKPRAKWLASITVKGIRKHLGMFSNIEDAAKARKQAEMLYGFHSNHGK